MNNKIMKLKIISDGTPGNTKIIDIETGKELDNVSKISWEIEVGDLAKTTVEFIKMPVELEGNTDK